MKLVKLMLPSSKPSVLLQMLLSTQMLPDGTLTLLPSRTSSPVFQVKRRLPLLTVQLLQLLLKMMMMTMMTIFSVPTVKPMKKLKSLRLNVLLNTKRRRLPSHKKLPSLLLSLMSSHGMMKLH